MRQLSTFAVLVFLMLLPVTAKAEGLIYQLPEDGAWVRFEVSGKGVASDGTVKVTAKGTQTLRSVGRVVVNDEQCRWIELESETVFERVGRKTVKLNEIIKLLIPEKYLTKGKNPRDHVLKAYQGASSETIRELDLKGNDARVIQSLDEIFHATLKQTSPLPAKTIKTIKTIQTIKTIKTKKQSWPCEGINGESTSDGTIFRTETYINKKTPFGVVTYKYEKERMRNNVSQGMRTSEWKFLASGKNAKSAAPDAD
jgi:hypothetical protein